MYIRISTFLVNDAKGWFIHDYGMFKFNYNPPTGITIEQQK